jgi:Uncharacterized conserved protein
MPFPALLIPLLFWSTLAAFSSWAVSRAVPLASSRSVDINAPLGTVWAYVTDPGRYPEWNDHISLAEGPDELTEGSTLRMRSRHPEERRLTKVFTATVTKREPDVELTWSTKILARWILAVTQSYNLEPLPENKTRLTQQMQFTGSLSPGVPFLTSIATIQETSNEKLRALIEGSTDNEN